MSNHIDDDDDDDDEQQHVKTKIIKCKTNNSYNILTSNGSSTTDVSTEHTSLKLHIRRVHSPPINDSTPANDVNDQQTKIVSRKFFNSNELTNPKTSRRLISTRRRSLIETDSSIYDLPKTIVHNHLNIYDENTLKKSNGNKRKLSNEQQEKKRTKLTTRTTNTTSK